MLDSDSSFSFESVFSHPSKIDELINAKRKQYKIYLYFIATEAPSINTERVSNRVQLGGHDVTSTLDSLFCIEAVQDAIDQYGVPAIFNTDQGCQFTSDNFVNLLESYGIRISMDGVNRALDNIYIERFWRSIKYEDIYLKQYDNMIEL